MSSAGGIWNAPVNSAKFNFRSFQIFSKNQMQWSARPLVESDVDRFKSEVRKNRLGGIMVHASYLLNLGSPKEDLREKSLNGLADELRRCDTLGIEYLVLHPGSSSGTTLKLAIESIASGIGSAIDQTERASVLIETAAGQGSTVGHTFEELASILDGVGNKDRSGVCFDTCHVYASGYDIKSPDGYESVMEKFDSLIGLKKLKGFHLNDSKKGLGSRVDRHEQIGDGMLGADGIMNFIRDNRLRGKPMVLETPLGEEGYEKDLNVIRKNLGEDGK